jgi:hypothetical protein
MFADAAHMCILENLKEAATMDADAAAALANSCIEEGIRLMRFIVADVTSEVCDLAY